MNEDSLNNANITDLKLIIKDLQESKERYRAITEQSAAGIMIVQNKKITYVNKCLADILEYDIQEILKWDLDRANQQVNPEDLNVIQSNYLTLFPSLEFRLISKSGKEHWVKQYNSKINYGGRTADQVIIIDITDRVRFEQKLKNSEHKFRQLIEDSPIGILTSDIHGNILTANERLVKILGSPSKEMTKAINLINYPNLIKAGFFVKFLECVQNEVEINEEITYLSKWGKKKYLQFKIVPLVTKSGNFSEILCIVNDITHLKEAQDEIRSKDRLFRKIVDFAPYPIALCDQSANIKFINQSFKKIFGISLNNNRNLEEYNNRIFLNHHKILSKTKSLQEEWRYAIKQAEYGDYITELKISDISNNLLDFRVTFSLIDNDLLIILDNLTKQRLYEQEKIRMQKLESLNILAGGIAHDFNNILVGIVGNISLLQMSDNLDDEIKESLNDLEKATYRAKGLTNQLLTFAKGGKPIKKNHEIVSLMKETIQLVSPGSNCMIQFFSEQEEYYSIIDASQIQQVFNNIILNAIQSMPNGGIVNIEIKEKKHDFPNSVPSRKEGYILINVIDKGNGIPKKIANRIFEPYFTTKAKGTGLGLASCYSIIRKHDGYISFNSEFEQGTTFSILLPQNEKKDVEIIETNEKFLISPKKALIMDDDEIVSTTLQKMLLKIDITSDIAHDGFEAISKYKIHLKAGDPYDIIFMDLTIPGSIGGKQTIKRLYAIDPNVKAIVSSGYSNSSVMSNYKKYGFLNVLTKPYQMKDLKSKILEVFPFIF